MSGGGSPFGLRNFSRQLFNSFDLSRKVEDVSGKLPGSLPKLSVPTIGLKEKLFNIEKKHNKDATAMKL